MEKLTAIGVTGQTLLSRMIWSPKMCEPADIASLPLMNDNGAGLAIAVSTYFDDVSRHGKKKEESTPSEGTKEEVRSNFGFLPQVPNFTKNLRTAFHLWDAVSDKSIPAV
jgi:Temperature dependent protein affecting M2 dsRNA replication